MTKIIKNITEGEALQAQSTNYVPDLEHPLELWCTSDIAQRLVQLESNPPYALLDVDRARKLTMINATAVPRTEDPGKHQNLGYKGQSLHSSKSMTLPIDTVRDYVSDMTPVDFQLPFKTMKAPGNSHCKETEYQHTKLGL